MESKVQEYAATAAELESKDQIYSAMVVYGLLTYEKGEVFIPNKELMGKFEELIQTKSSLGYIYRLAKESNRMDIVRKKITRVQDRSTLMIAPAANSQ